MPITTPTVAPTTAEFLLDFPEFTGNLTDPNAVQFSPSALTYWLTVATYLLNQARWGKMYYTACELFMAHNLALEAWAAQGSPGQVIPGIAKGSIAGKSAGDVSLTYNNAATLELDAGQWNYTTYGQRFIHLVRLFGAGPIQITGGGCYSPYNTGAWAGPWCFNVPNPEL